LHAVWAIDDALRRGLVDQGTLKVSLHGRPGGAGDGVARARIAEANGVAESILETAGRLALADSRVPLPVPQYEVVEDGTLVARLDGAYPDRRLGLEFDGQGVHGALRAIFHDRWRQNRLLALGWTLLRFTWWDVVHDPKGFVAAVCAALSSTA
jgi:hypothetical protein